MKQVVVLGSNGQLGQTINSLNKDYVFFSHQEVDITIKEDLEKIFKSNQFSYCINCAAYTDVEGAESDEDKAFLINGEGVRNIAQVCKKYNTVLIHISTDYVFDGLSTEPYKTTDLPNPINQYGKSKLQGEKNIQRILSEHYIIRCSWLYSPYGKNFVKTIISKVQENKNLTITTDEVGTPTSCLELYKFIKYIIEQDKIPYGIYNFSAKGSTTWYLFALEIVKHIFPDKISDIFPTNTYKTEAKRPKFSVLDVHKTEAVYKKLKDWKKSVEDVTEEIKRKSNL